MKKYLVPFILVTFCFALWGFANDVTNPMVKAFSKIFRMSVTDGSLVQVAFYGGYFAMAFPAAIFIRKYSYKAGVLMGLGLYATGALLFFPSKAIGIYGCFLIAYFIMTCGLSFLETSCNPYILSMGEPETATRRLNLAQCFNPCGSIIGMFVAMNFIQAKLNPLSSDERALLSDADFEAVKNADLDVLISPYLAIGAVIVVMFLIILFTKMPKNADQSHDIHIMTTLRRLVTLKRYREGVIAQFFYVGAQIMCWTFIIQYGTRVFMAEGMEEQAAEVLSQRFNIYAMLFFICSRFIATWLMRPVPRPYGCLLSRVCQWLYVADVPHHLRHCPRRLRRRCEVRCCGTHHGHPRWLRLTPIAGDVHRCRHDQLLVHPALRLLPRRNRLWLPSRHDARIVLFTVYGLQFTVDNLASHSCCL